MSIIPPALDDRDFDDLVDELLARIPAHTPEWTNPRLGDPGRTLLELFAWLADTLLYRANLIPERQRLAFLRLLGVQMRPALPARGLVSLSLDDEALTQAVIIQPLAQVKGPVNFETRAELTVLPVTAEAYYKRALSTDEETAFAGVLPGLQQIYNLNGARPRPYVTTPIFTGGAMVTQGFDLIEQTVDKSLWLALLASKEELVGPVAETLGASANGGQQLISLGFMPLIEVPALFEEIGPRGRLPHVWEITSVNDRGEVEYSPLDLVSDTTGGLTQQGVQRLGLPARRFIGRPSNDVSQNLFAGVKDRPPRLDDPAKADRLVAWLRLRPSAPLQKLALSWVGLNAVEIDQRRTITAQVIGQSDGSADQEFQLPGQAVEVETLQIQVEEPGQGYRLWQRIDDLALAGRDSAVYSLDSQAGLIRVGNQVRGRIPALGARVRVAFMRAGGGQAGNLPPGTLTEISARDLDGKPITKLKVGQQLPTAGGEEAETLAAAEQRIPALFRHGDRAITAEDYRQLAADTPGVRLGRVELLSRFKPQQRRNNVPGVISVLVLPFKPAANLPNPRPDRPLLESVHAYLEVRRPLGTELYVIGCEYVPIGLGVSVTIAEGFGREQVLKEVRETLRTFLWPLPPGGPQGTGWPLNRVVRDRELEVIVARVPGVNGVIGSGVNLFERDGDDWRLIPRSNLNAPAEIPLQPWQLPELLSLVVLADEATPTDLRGAPNPFALEEEVAVPVVPEVCY